MLTLGSRSGPSCTSRAATSSTSKSSFRVARTGRVQTRHEWSRRATRQGSRIMKRLLTLSSLLFAACGDDIKGTPDAAVNPDSQDVDAMVDAPVALTWPTPVEVTLSTDGPDLFMSAVAGPNGTFYA